MKLVSSLCLVSLLALCLSGCSKSSSPTSGNTNPTGNSNSIQTLFPLAVGDSWEYLQNDYNPTNGQIMQVDSFKDTIASAITYDGMPAFSVKENAVFLTEYYSGTDLFAGQDNVSNPGLILRYPMSVGETVVLTDTTYSNGERQRTSLTLLSTADTVVVPAGTFTSLRYRMAAEAGTAGALDTLAFIDNFYASGVGLVRLVGYSKSPGGADVLGFDKQLVRYSVK